MKKLWNWKRFRLYGLLGLAFFFIGVITDALQHPATLLPRVFNNLWGVSYVTLINYFLFEYTLPGLSLKRIIRSLLLITMHIFLYSWGMYAWRNTGIAVHFYTPLMAHKNVSAAVADRMGYSMGSLVFFGIIRHLYNYFRLKQATQQLRIEKQQAELNYLRSQTNPHFLFNTLNNIYSLARDKSDLAAESILHLSKILRYMLYETKGDYIAIEQELKIMADYIALEKLRYDDSLRVNFNHDIEDRQQALPPLLLMPLVENAFKHGVSETRQQPFIDIHLSVNKRQLAFVVKNSTGEPVGAQPGRESIGLANLRRQLELLYTDHRLTVQWESYVFTASLQINLASHV